MATESAERPERAWAARSRGGRAAGALQGEAGLGGGRGGLPGSRATSRFRWTRSARRSRCRGCPRQALQAKLRVLEAADGLLGPADGAAPPQAKLTSDDRDRAGLPRAAGRGAEQMVGGKLGSDVWEQRALSDAAGTASAKAVVPLATSCFLPSLKAKTAGSQSLA
ncbi:unnamed protein product [Prorocentrum cordatum]|uniref:Uncharacterized protein n=1 Tax=Prorocentrum cordatum TaxID=2364126 RepID=A0ABN9WCC2_9DINO|nr:unnamed protein product [Polarella glacialis]